MWKTSRTLHLMHNVVKQLGTYKVLNFGNNKNIVNLNFLQLPSNLIVIACPIVWEV